MINGQKHYDTALSYYALNTSKKNTLLAIQHFEKAAELDFPDAYYFLGRFYGLGDGVALNQDKSWAYYEKGHDLGSYKCGYAMGLAYHTGHGIEQDDDLSKELFQQSFQFIKLEAEMGDAVSTHILGTYYYYGFYVQRYIFTAIDWFKKAADLGYSDSQYMLGMIYETIGEDTSNAQEQARTYYERAAKQDHPYALYALGIWAIELEQYKQAEFYLERAANQQYGLAAYTLAKILDERDPRHPARAFEWFMVAAKQGHTEAAYYVGLYYQNGKGIEQDISEAITWYEKAAIKNDRDALYHLAMILIRLEDKDWASIHTLLTKAAEQDHPNAAYNLAVMYQKGDGVQMNNEQAIYWYEKAAHAGLPNAQYNLGMIYFEGKLVKKDEQKAKELWQLAANKGFDPAIKLIQSIDNYKKLQKSGWQS